MPLKVCYIAFKSIHIDRCIEWMVNRGHEVHLISHKPCEIKGVIFHLLDLEKNSDKGRLIRYLSLDFNSYRWRRSMSFLKVRRLIKKIRPDILHLHTLYFPSYCGVFAGIRPLIISPWNGDILWTPPRAWYYKLFVGYALRKADALTSDNRVMKKGCLMYGVKEEKIHVVRWYGANLRRFFPQKKRDPEITAKLQLGDSPVILSTRSLSEGYNIDIIIKAIPLVLQKKHEAKFVFIWHGGDQLAKIENLIYQLGIDRAVRLVGRVDNYNNIPRYYSLSTIAVSIASPDSTPASLFEAMACGIPTIVSNEPAITEFIKDDWNGYVVSPRDHKELAEKIVKLLDDPVKCRLFSERNLELVKEKAGFDNEMGKVEELYRCLVKEARR